MTFTPNWGRRALDLSGHSLRCRNLGSFSKSLEAPRLPRQFTRRRHHVRCG
ncbi:MAG: hypothetical protein E7774_16555 [Bradyrhizobium sp.]|nr:MAG: hypothetical protein E7774_16555 [Bradyrhizobium sp.]